MRAVRPGARDRDFPKAAILPRRAQEVVQLIQVRMGVRVPRAVHRDRGAFYDLLQEGLDLSDVGGIFQDSPVLGSVPGLPGVRDEGASEGRPRSGYRFDALAHTNEQRALGIGERPYPWADGVEDPAALPQGALHRDGHGRAEILPGGDVAYRWVPVSAVQVVVDHLGLQSGEREAAEPLTDRQLELESPIFGAEVVVFHDHVTVLYDAPTRKIRATDLLGERQQRVEGLIVFVPYRPRHLGYRIAEERPLLVFNLQERLQSLPEDPIEERLQSVPEDIILYA